MTKREKNRGIKLGTKERTNRTKGREEGTTRYTNERKRNGKKRKGIIKWDKKCDKRDRFRKAAFHRKSLYNITSL